MAFSAGGVIFSIIALITMIGPYAADWNETHVKNPNWPPHARFHNGQTMTTGLLIGALILYYTHIARSRDVASIYVDFVLVLVHLYYVPALSGILYPGALWIDPEFGDGSPQKRGFSGLLAVAWGAWWLERRRLETGSRSAQVKRDKGIERSK